MPSSGTPPANPRTGGVTPPNQHKAPAGPRPSEPPTPPQSEDEEAAERARAGGFHESSYELRQGLDILESEWPADTTIPGALGDR